MPPNATTPPIGTVPRTAGIKRLLGTLSIFTMLMTIPQVLTIWVGRRAAGVSLLSWSAYLLSAVVWLWYGLLKRDKNIYRPALAGSCSMAPLF